MPIKGFDKFREKFPALSGKKIAILPLYAIAMITIAFAVYFTFDSLPETLTSSGINSILLSFFPLIGVVIMEVVSFLLVWQLWFRRDHFKEKYGPTSFQQIFLIGFAGIIWILTIAFNQYIPFYFFAPDFWASSPIQVVTTPLETLLGIAGTIIFCIKTSFAAILFSIGLLMIVRAIQTFGFDYMAVVYLYFPEESQIQKNEIYSALRHPTYAGVLLICLGGTIFTFTLLSFATYLLYLVGFYLHIHFVEEKELIKRFGDSYRKYQAEVPAFLVNPRKIKTLWRFLFKKKQKIAKE